MHAVVGRWRVDGSRPEEQRGVLQRVIVPSVVRNPGFQHGYWAGDAASDLEVTFIAFDTEAHARAFSESVVANRENKARSGIELVDIVVVAVYAEAPTVANPIEPVAPPFTYGSRDVQPGYESTWQTGGPTIDPDPWADRD